MASTRTMRSSRLASPMETSTRDTAAVKREVQKPREKQTSLGNWVEPPLRTPAPSFEDYKGLERQGVLEHMAPLGSFPNHKAKQRLKALNGPRRSSQLRNGSNAMTEDERATPEPTPPPNPRRFESRKSVSREKDKDQDYAPPAASRPASTKHAPAQTTQRPVVVRTFAREQRLRQIVDSAVKRAEELNNPYLGKAVQELFNRSYYDQAIADLLDAVLSQKPTPEQTAEFQAMVKLMRKEIKDAENESSLQSPNALSFNANSSIKSPTKGTNSSASLRGQPFPDTPGSNTNQADKSPSSKHRPKRMDTNGTSSKAERPAKRMKRSYSNASSTSSLSSLTSGLSGNSNRSPMPSSRKIPFNNDVPGPTPPPDSKVSGAGPKLLSFPINSRSKPAKKVAATSAGPVEASADELAAKRRQLQKTFEYTVNDSSVRETPVAKPPQQRRKSHQISSPLPLRTQHTRLRNGVHRHELAEDYDVPSPASSYHGELLAPPAAEGHILTRGTTPTQLGRPPKHVKKAARIKMSPQKAKPTTAGQPRPGGDGDADGLSDNASELDNDDICAACGGEGEVLCCDGCTRSFHYICLDPPQHSAPQGEWLCRHCIATKLKPQGSDLEKVVDGVTDGVLEPIFKKLQGKNPHCFSLPNVIRNHFEGVKTAPSGEYEELAPTKAKSRTNIDMQAELARAKDVIKDGAALCFACGRTSHNNCELIACSFCPLNWHLDCLDPPLATSPFRQDLLNPTGPQRKIVWQCPNHADSEMQTLTEPTAGRRGTVRNIGGKVKKVRRPKHATIKDVGLRRGYVNNGIIEILNDPSDEEDGYEAPTGTVPRLRELGIKLDFFDRVRASNMCTPKPVLERDAKKLQVAAAAKEHQRQDFRKAAKIATEAQEALRKRSFTEQQVALALTGMQSPGLAPNVGEAPVDNLIGTLISEAPEEVAKLFAQAEVPTDAQADFLRLAIARMQEILARKKV